MHRDQLEISYCSFKVGCVTYENVSKWLDRGSNTKEFDVYFSFLPPARRGRGILVAPGFCPASLFPVGTKTTGQFF